MKKVYFVSFLLFSLLFLSPAFVSARSISEITDWYINSFDTTIVVNKDSSLLVTENIVADCGNLPNKHGIFRVVPTQIKTDKGIFKTPIELISITDFEGKPFKYENIWDSGTITWKIGNPDITVIGRNNYKIVYKVKNAIRFLNNDSDEFYWNLLGTFWQIDIDNFTAKIIFPPEIAEGNTEIDYYTGASGSKDKSLAAYNWIGANTIYFYSTDKLLPGEGITVSVTFPKNIFIPYIPNFWEKNGQYFWYLCFLLPILLFAITFLIWQKYGKDPKIKSPIPPEFGIPENITPMQMGLVIKSGWWQDRLITATIVDLAVRGIIVIERIEEKILFIDADDYKLSKGKNYNKEALTEPEKVLIESIFQDNSFTKIIRINNQPEVTISGKESVKISDLKNNFANNVAKIKKSGQDDLEKRGWGSGKGLKYSAVFIGLGVFAMFLSIFLLSAVLVFGAWQLPLSLFLSGFIFIFFGIIMPKRTQKGVDLLFKVKGFERYMRQAEDYRQQFYEKENIFDKFLPYAIVFGIADLWAEKMELIYGQEYFKTYHPVWLAGATSANFNISSFTHQLNSITSSISSSTSSSSGSHGGGSSGGGGGGGGGGGW